MSTEFIEKADPALDPKRFAPLQIRQLMPHFGAQIEGIHLAADLSEDIRALLREAWLAYGVIILTRQKSLDPDEHLAAVTIFGSPDLGSRQIDERAAQVDVFTTDECRPPVTNLWHADNTTREIPSIGTMIQIQDCPPVGGNTSWASTRKAYRCLSEPMKGYLEGLTAVHYWDGRGRPRVRPPTPNVRDRADLDAAWDDEAYFKTLRENPPRHHPVVATHPITGEKTLYVNETYTTFIEGLHQYESRAILNFLYSWIRMPEFCMTHNWAPNDVAIWDNYAVQHYALADYVQQRVAQRVTFVGANDPIV
jgi:taurine dioxygenase